LNNPGLFHLVLDPAFSNLCDGLADLEGHRPGFRIRHETARTQLLAELADRGHQIRRRDRIIEIHPAALDLLHEIIRADEIRTGLSRFLFLFPLREDNHPYLLACAMRKRRCPAHHLVRTLWIDTQPDRQIDGLIEFRVCRTFDQRDGISERVRTRFHLRQRGLHFLAHHKYSLRCRYP